MISPSAAPRRCWLVLLLLVLIIGGCTSPAEPADSVNAETELPPGADPFPASAYEGKLEPFAYGLGDYTEGMLEELGEPQAMDYLTGGLYFDYPEVVYFTDAQLREDDSIAPGSVKRIGMRPGTELFGVTVGDTFSEIREILGEQGTVRSMVENANDGYYEDQWTLHYTLGDYELVFAANAEDEATIAAYYEVGA
ncbi:DUF4309 domain-containing protein [Paenibacillus daejeonensis]|uniref:DUF4309 domain-containing protein n=1 Tax=Paenibacillus daejeonensis TaxID=135193 RepID=UPI00037B2FE7|nr:DUF4309 domain-containing protein [Paenibacillus daejeonensis]